MKKNKLAVGVATAALVFGGMFVSSAEEHGCPNENSGFVRVAAEGEFADADEDGDGFVCVKEHPARGGPKEGTFIVKDTELPEEEEEEEDEELLELNL